MGAFERAVYFDYVRDRLFGGSLTQQQVDGQNFILDAWEDRMDEYGSTDNRWLGYCLATTYHETAQKMWPIEEYGKGGNAAYAKPDPTTGQCYYGRGFVQLTWRDNYARADTELGLEHEASCEWHAENALDPKVAADTMFIGMEEGWFRKSSDGKPQMLARYFNETKDDPYGAREIINGDKHIVPSWSNGKSIGNLIKDYYMVFTAALNAAWTDEVPPEPEPEPEPEPGLETRQFLVTVTGAGPISIDIQEVDNGIAEGTQRDDAEGAETGPVPGQGRGGRRR